MSPSLVWLAAGVAVALAAMAYVRLAPSPPERWHLDPLTAPATGRPNSWRIVPQGVDGARADAQGPEFAVLAERLAQALDAVALGEPRTRRLAGRPEDLWTSYVQRSRVMGFPDYISVRALDLGDGRAGLAIYARARFGQSDLGVNRARVERWLGDLDLPPAGP